MDSLGYFDTKQNIQVFLSSFSKKNFDATLGCVVFINFSQTKQRKEGFDHVLACVFSLGNSSDRTSNQSRLPAEFKHITRRRKRN